MTKEIWKVYKDTRYVPNGALWEVSDQGRFRKNGILIEPKINNGYYMIGSGWISLHRVVAELFIPNSNNYNEVDHINGDKLDNRAINLQWCSHKQNMNNPITRKRNSEAQKIAQNKTEIRKKKSESLKGKPQSEESNKKRSVAMKGKIRGPQSEEHRKHISEAKKNKHRVYHEDGTYHMEKNIIIN